MEEIKVIIELDGEVEQDDRFGIEDAIYDALAEQGFKVKSVKVKF